MKYLGIALGCLVLLVVAIIGLLQIKPLRQSALQYALAEINSGETRIAMDDVTGQWPQHLHVSGLTVADGDSVWLSIGETDIVWSPLALLRGQVLVREFSAAGVHLPRLPSGGDSPDEETPGNPFDLPTLPVAVKIEKGRIEGLDLGRGLVTPAGGQVGRRLALLDLDTSLELARNKLELLLEITRKDEVPGKVSLSLLFAPRARQLTLDLSVEDGDATHKGLVAELAGLDMSPFKLTASTHTNGEKVTGDMHLDGGKSLLLDVSANGRWTRDLALALSSSASGRLVADSLDGFGEPRDIHLSTDFLWDSKDTISLDKLDVKAGSLNVTGHAALQSVSRAAPHRLAASGVLTGLDHLLDKPGNAAVATLDWSLAALLDMRNDSVEVSPLKLTSPAGEAEFTGVTALDGSTVKGDLNAAFSDLAPVGELVGQPLSGPATASLSPLAIEPDGSIIGDFLIRTEGVDAGDPALTALLGSVTADGSLLVPGGGGFKLPSFRVTPLSGAYTLDGNIASTPADVLTGEVHFSASEIAALLPGGEARGAVKLDAALSGSASAPAIALDASLARGAIFGTHTDELLVKAQTADGKSGPVSLRFKGAPGVASLDAMLELPGAGGARLTGLKGNLFGAGLTGDIAVDDASLVTASISGAHMHLAPFATLAGIALDGAGDLSLRAAPVNGKQTAQLDFKSPRINVEGVTLDSAALAAALDDLFGNPTIDASLTAASGQFDLTHLDGVTVTAKGPFDRLALDAAITGTLESHMPKRLSLSASALLKADKATSLALDAFDLTLGKASATLVKPVTLDLSNGVAMRGLQLDVTGVTGTGNISGDLTLGSTARMTMAFERMPLDLLALAVPGDVEGAVDGTLALDSALGAGKLALNFDQVRVAQDIDDSRPAFSASVDGTWAKSRLDLAAAAHGVSTQPFTLKASLPFIRPQGSAFPALAKRGRVEGSLVWDGPLEALAALASLEGQRVSGNAKVALTASGDVSSPRVNGEATLSGGSFENFSTGTVLRKIEARIDGRDSQTLDFTLSATDGEAGRVDGRGTITLDRNVERGIDIDLKVSNARLVRRSDLDATIDGDVSLKGPAFPPTLERPATLAGELTTRSMHIRIPDSLPADVPLVEIIEVNGDSTSKGRSLDATEAPLPLLLDLTLATSKPLRISGRGLDSLWTGKLAVAGRVDKPLIRGQLNSERGTLDFAGKTFKLTKGNVTFPGTFPIAPTFTAKLLYEKDDFQATIGVSGDSARPQITLSSSPSLPKDEILSRILFNKGVGELSALETLQLARTLAELSGVNIGGSGGGIMDRVQETLSLDVLRIDSGASGATTVSAGKYIQEGVYVGVEQGALASDSSVKVEIDVTPQISVETKVGQNASGEVGVNWKWDY